MKFSVQVPKLHTLIDVGRLRAAIDRGLDESAESVAKDLEKPTQQWKRKVKMQIKAIANGRIISTDNAVYGYVSEGTRPHIIRAKNAKYLAFGSVYTPKTRPGSLDSSSGGSGPVDTFRRQVRHPGTEAREFVQQAAKIAQKDVPRRMRQAVKEGTR